MICSGGERFTRLLFPDWVSFRGCTYVRVLFVLFRDRRNQMLLGKSATMPRMMKTGTTIVGVTYKVGLTRLQGVYTMPSFKHYLSCRPLVSLLNLRVSHWIISTTTCDTPPTLYPVAWFVRRMALFLEPTPGLPTAMWYALHSVFSVQNDDAYRSLPHNPRRCVDRGQKLLQDPLHGP